MPISSGSLGGGGGGSSAAASVYWAEHRIPDTSAIYSDFDLLTPVDWADIAAGATIVSRADLQVYYKTGSGVEKAQGNDIVLINGDTSALDFGRVCWVDRGSVGGAIHPILMSVMPGMATGVLDEGPVLVCVTTPMDTGVATNDGNIPQFEPVRVTLGSPRCRVQINGTGLAGETIFLKTDGTFTTTRPVGQTYYEIGRIIVGPFADGTADMWFYPRFHLGAASVSGSVIDNAITDSRAVSVIGRYIVPKENLIAIPPVDLLNDFDGRSSQYADWSGAYDTTDPLNPFPTGFTFSVPDDGDTVIITTGSRTGEVWRYKASTTSWSKVTQTTGLPTYTWDKTKSYLAGDLVIYNQTLWQANANIAANTDFATGTSGQTWKQIGVSGAAEYGGQAAPNGTTAITTGVNAWQDYFTFTLPSAGVWDVSSIIHHDAAANVGVAHAIKRANGSVVGSSSVLTYANASTHTMATHGRSTIVTTAAETLTVVVQRTVASTANVISDGNRNQSKVIWNKIAGYQPVVGQAVDYLQVRRAGATLNLAASTDIVFNTVVSGNIGYATGTGVISLTAGKTYRFSATISMLSYSTINSWLTYALVDAATNTQISPSFILLPMNYAAAESVGSLDFIYTPVTNQTVKLRVIGASGTGVMRDDMASMLLVQQIGSTALATTAAPSYQVVATSNVTYTLPASYALDTCRYNAVTASECLGGAQAWFNTSTYRFTPQVAGWWDVTAAYGVYRGTTAESYLRLVKNGVVISNNGGFGASDALTRRIIYLNGTTDYIVVQNMGSQASTRTQNSSISTFQARWLGA